MLAVYTPYILFGIANFLVCLIWGLRLESRVNVAEQRHIDLRELIASQLGSIDQRLGRIEQAMNGALRYD